MDKALHLLSLTELSRLLHQRALTSVALTEYFLARITRFNPVLNAFIYVDAERALRDARCADEALNQGKASGPLTGIPYALKDIFDVEGEPTTCHSHLMLHHRAARSSTVERRLSASGAVYLGKLATHEFALGGPSHELPFPPARNPWNRSHFTGASSSGAGAAVAAGLVPIAIGSDTSGSIRGPACLCGVVGFKPTYGLVSRAGVFPLSWTLDHCGPLTRFSDDARWVMQVIAGYDSADPTTLTRKLDFSPRTVAWPQHRIAWPRHLLTDNPHTDPALIAAMDRVVENLTDAGAQVEEITFKDFALFNACGRIIMAAESFAVHQHNLRERGNEYGRFTYQRILPGATISAAELMDALRLRTALTGWLNRELFSHFSLLLFPGTLRAAPRFSEFSPDWPPASYVVPTQTIPFNVTGNPALSLPLGLTNEKLPLGMQLVGRLFDDSRVLDAGDSMEKWLTMPALSDDVILHQQIEPAA
ncbi:amidase [Dickeya poaceiphila]|uniref:amidase n=1 Tax=Dickeya poaceiphila TaxID=568768 RepID=UPI0003A582E4|nr:amidase [Dickeya poaceiphila]